MNEENVCIIRTPFYSIRAEQCLNMAHNANGWAWLFENFSWFISKPSCCHREYDGRIYLVVKTPLLELMKTPLLELMKTFREMLDRGVREWSRPELLDQELAKDIATIRREWNWKSRPHSKRFMKLVGTPIGEMEAAAVKTAIMDYEDWYLERHDATKSMKWDIHQFLEDREAAQKHIGIELLIDRILKDWKEAN